MEIFDLTENDSGFEDMEVEEVDEWPVQAITDIELNEQLPEVERQHH